MAGKKDPVELDSSLILWSGIGGVEEVGTSNHQFTYIILLEHSLSIVLG